MSHPVHSAYFACFSIGKVVLINSALVRHFSITFTWRPLINLVGIQPRMGSGWTTAAVCAVGPLVAELRHVICHHLWDGIRNVWTYSCTFSRWLIDILVRMVRQNHALSRMTAVWLLPVVTLVVGSSVGGLLAAALKSDSHTLALLTTAFSMTMVLIGLTFSMMIITIYLMRLVIHGPPDSSLVFSPFLVLGPLAQGGYSLLVNGSLLSELIPVHVGPTFPQLQLAGQMIFAVCFCGAYVLFSMAVAWIILAGCSIGRTIRNSTIPFSMSFWGLIFPNGVFAQLLLQFASILDSPFFRGFGTAWSCRLQLWHQNFRSGFTGSHSHVVAGITFGLWMFVFVRTVPAFIDGTIFEPTDLYEDTSSPDTPVLEDSKTERHFQLRDL